MEVHIKKPVGLSSLRYYWNRLWGKKNPLEARHSVVIHDYDTWDAGHTLSHILVPLLKKYKELNIGHPVVEEMNSAEDWNTVLDQMIWSFEQIRDEEWEALYCENKRNEKGEKEMSIDREGITAHYEEIQKGLRLFGKYYNFLGW